MKDLAQFDGLTFRATEAEDLPLIGRWLEADEDHAGRIEPEYFAGSEGCFALEDDAGVVFFIRLAKAARVRIQFNTNAKDRRQRARVARALARGMAVLEVGLARSGVDEWVFDTANPDLRKFALGTLGFAQQNNDLVREIRDLEREAEEVA